MRTPFNPVGRASTLSVPPVSSWPTGRVWPNGNFTVGTTRSVPSEDSLLTSAISSEIPDWFLMPDAEGDGLPLTSSNVPIPHKPPSRAKKGLSGITGYGQQMLRSAAYLVERDYGKSDLCFCTLTLPTLSDKARRQLQGNWATLLNRLVQFVIRKLEQAERPPKVFGCVEVQSQRLEKYQAGYLHLHAIWPAHSNQSGRTWAVSWEEIRTWWKAAIERFSGEMITVYPRVETSPVKCSAERYLGKYLSKGGGLIEKFIETEGEESCPTAWWFMSAAMKAQISEETVEGVEVGVILDAMVQTALENSDLAAFDWMRHVDMRVGTALKTVGWCGRLTPECLLDVRSMFTG